MGYGSKRPVYSLRHDALCGFLRGESLRGESNQRKKGSMNSFGPVDSEKGGRGCS